VGTSIEEARDADGKRRVQKRGNRIFDIVPEAKMTFSKLAGWYLELEKVKALSSYWRVQIALDNFNSEFGDLLVRDIGLSQVENYQQKRLNVGMAPGTVDREVGEIKTMIYKAHDDGLLGDRIAMTFKKVKKQLKRGSNARERTMTTTEYLGLTTGKHKVKTKTGKEKLRDNSPTHLKPILIVVLYTVMRKGELLGLKWSYIDREKGFIRLPVEMTKEGKPKSIPINRHVREVLTRLPRSLHHEYVFTYRRQRIKNLRRSFESACKNADIPHGRKTENGLVFHDIRRTVRTNMLRAGVDKALRDTILGHSLQGMDAYYLKASDEDLKAAMDQYSTWMDAHIANVTQTFTQPAKKG
jgi:integrase